MLLPRDRSYSPSSASLNGAQSVKRACSTLDIFRPKYGLTTAWTTLCRDVLRLSQFDTRSVYPDMT